VIAIVQTAQAGGRAAAVRDGRFEYPYMAAKRTTGKQKPFDPEPG
jgi:hypothetical protein